MSCVVLVLGVVLRPPAPTQLSLDRFRESSSLVHSLFLLQTSGSILKESLYSMDSGHLVGDTYHVRLHIMCVKYSLEYVRCFSSAGDYLQTM